MKKKNYPWFILVIGLALGLLTYQKTLTYRSSATEGQKTFLTVDPAACASEPLFSEYRFDDKAKFNQYGKNGYRWWERRRKGAAEELHRSPNQEQGNYSLITLDGNRKKDATGPFSGLYHLPDLIELDTSCQGVYLYQCLIDRCSIPPSGKELGPDVYRQWNEEMTLLGYYPKNTIPQNILPLLSPGKFLLTPWCDSQWFECGQ